MLWVLTVLGIITDLSDDTCFVFPVIHHLLLCCSVNFEARTYLMLPVSEHEHTCVPFCELRIRPICFILLLPLLYYPTRLGKTKKSAWCPVRVFLE